MQTNFRRSRWLRLVLLISIIGSLLWVQPAVATAQESSPVIAVTGDELSGLALSADNQMVAVNGDEILASNEERFGPIFLVENYDSTNPIMKRIGTIPGATDAEGITWIGNDDGANIYIVSSETRNSFTSQAFIVAIRPEGTNYSVKTLAGPLELFTNSRGRDGVSTPDENDGAEGITFAGQVNDQLSLYSVREGKGSKSTAALFSHAVTVPGLSQGSPRWSAATITTTLRQANLGIADASDIAYNSAENELWITTEEDAKQVVRFTPDGNRKSVALTSGIEKMSQPEAVTFAPEGSNARAKVYLGGESSEIVRWVFQSQAPKPAAPISAVGSSDAISVGEAACVNGRGQLTFVIKNNDNTRHRYFYKAGPPHGADVDLEPGQTATRTLSGIESGLQQIFVARDRDDNIVQRFAAQAFCPATAQAFEISDASCVNGAGSITFTIPNTDSRAHRYFVKAAPPHGADRVIEANGVGQIRLSGIPSGKQRVYVAQDSPTNIVHEFPQQSFCAPTNQQITISRPTCFNGAGRIAFTIPNTDTKSHRYYVKAGPPHGWDIVVPSNEIRTIVLDGIRSGFPEVYVARDSPDNIVYRFSDVTVDCS